MQHTAPMPELDLQALQQKLDDVRRSARGQARLPRLRVLLVLGLRGRLRLDP
jgi:hypothetical protein